MPHEVRVYFEGDPKLRPGFRSFFGGRAVAIGCRSRARTLKSFALALQQHPGALNILLVDAEGPVTTSGPWEHLASLGSTRLDRPDGANDSHAHLMVQIMESWFLADNDALAGFYGRDFARNKLPNRSDIEGISRADVEQALKEATSKSKKGPYHKTAHAPGLLAAIDPAKVRAASPWCNRLFQTIEQAIESP